MVARLLLTVLGVLSWTDKGSSFTPASRTESPVEFTTSPVRCSPTKQVSGFVWPPPTLPPPPIPGGGNHRALQLPTFPLSFEDGRGPYSPARLPLAQDERIREGPAAGKRDRAGRPAVRPRSQTAGSFLDCPQVPAAPEAWGQQPGQGRHRPPPARPPPRPAPPALPFPPPPASDSDGLGLGLPAAQREPGPSGPVRRRPARNPTSCSVGPRGPTTRVPACSRTFMIGLGQRRSSPFRKVLANPAMGCSL